MPAAEIITQALDAPRDKFLDYALTHSARASQPQWAPALAANRLTFGGRTAHADFLRKLAGTPPAPPSPGYTTYEMACLPCHQPDGKGLPGVYPPLTGSDWVSGDKTRLIKVVLHGLTGPITVAGKTFVMENPVPMPAMGGLDDQQVAEVLTFIRTDFGGRAAAVTAAEVKAIRSASGNRETPWTEKELR